jgi:WD repeat-containing protein 35
VRHLWIGCYLPRQVPIVGINWYDGGEGCSDPLAPTLAIAYENGRVQIMRNESDEDPVLIDTEMKLTQCRWNSNGTVLALSGVSSGAGGDKVGHSRTNFPRSFCRQHIMSRVPLQKEMAQVQFYNPFGVHLRTLKIPGTGISALSWEGGGLRIAVRPVFMFPFCSLAFYCLELWQFAVDSYVYFANIRPDYKWASFGSCVVYAFNKPDKPEQCIVFWDTASEEKCAGPCHHSLLSCVPMSACG